MEWYWWFLIGVAVWLVIGIGFTIAVNIRFGHYWKKCQDAGELPSEDPVDVVLRHFLTVVLWSIIPLRWKSIAERERERERRGHG